MSANEVSHAGLNLGDTDRKTHEQAGSDVFGFWVFLMSDAVIFALLFATYGVMLPGTAGGPTPAQRVQDRPRVHRDADPADEQLHFRHGLAGDEA